MRIAALPGDREHVPATGGTMEFWLRRRPPARRLVAPGLSHLGPQALRAAPGIWTPPSNDSRSSASRQGGSNAASIQGLQLRPGKFGHVALALGDRPALYVDGKRVGEAGPATAAGALRRPGQAQPALGCPREWAGLRRSIAVDEFRVSRTLRYQGETIAAPTAPFGPDADTLLLDHFDSRFRPDGEDAETQATIISGAVRRAGRRAQSELQVRDRQVRRRAWTSRCCAAMPRAEAVKRWGFNAALHWFWLETRPTRKYGWPSPLFIEPELQEPARARSRRTRPWGCGPAPTRLPGGRRALGAGATSSATSGAGGRMSTQPSEPPKGHYFWDVCARAGLRRLHRRRRRQWLLDDVGCTGLLHRRRAPRPTPAATPTTAAATGRARAAALRPCRCSPPARCSSACTSSPSRRPDGYLVNHMSFNTFMPTMSFTDVMYSGEHEQYEDLTRFRVRWQGGNRGFWTVLLGGRRAHLRAAAHDLVPAARRLGLAAGLARTATTPRARPPTCGRRTTASATARRSGSPTTGPSRAWRAATTRRRRRASMCTPAGARWWWSPTSRPPLRRRRWPWTSRPWASSRPGPRTP